MLACAFTQRELSPMIAMNMGKMQVPDFHQCNGPPWQSPPPPRAMQEALSHQATVLHAQVVEGIWALLPVNPTTFLQT